MCIATVLAEMQQAVCEQLESAGDWLVAKMAWAECLAVYVH